MIVSFSLHVSTLDCRAGHGRHHLLLSKQVSLHACAALGVVHTECMEQGTDLQKSYIAGFYNLSVRCSCHH